MSTTTMGRTTQKRRDWSLFACGILVFIAGLVVMFAPGISMVTIAIIAGVFFLIAGIGSCMTYSKMRGAVDGSGWVLANGICDIILGALFVIFPGLTAAMLPWFVGFTVIFYSAYAIIAGIAMRKYLPMWGFVLATGIIGLLCGVLFIAYPAAFPIYLAIILMMRGITMAIDGILAPNELDYL